MDVEFYFDISCPQAYLAYTQLEALEQRQGAQVLLKPVSLTGLYRIWTQHEEAPQVRYSAARRRMEHHDLMRQAEALQVFLNEAATLDPPNGIDAMRLIVAAPAELRPTLIRNLFQVLWVDGEDVDNRGVLEWIAGVSGVYPARLDRPEARTELDAATEAAANSGVFGAPCFRVDGRLW
jgi:2-hydroxychromene-2-carboxylate isomerase